MHNFNVEVFCDLHHFPRESCHGNYSLFFRSSLVPEGTLGDLANQVIKPVISSPSFTGAGTDAVYFQAGTSDLQTYLTECPTLSSITQCHLSVVKDLLKAYPTHVFVAGVPPVVNEYVCLFLLCLVNMYICSFL